MPSKTFFPLASSSSDRHCRHIYYGCRTSIIYPYYLQNESKGRDEHLYAESHKYDSDARKYLVHDALVCEHRPCEHKQENSNKGCDRPREIKHDKKRNCCGRQCPYRGKLPNEGEANRTPKNIER